MAVKIPKKKMTKSDIDSILLASRIIDNIGKKYNITGSLTQVYIEAIKQQIRNN